MLFDAGYYYHAVRVMDEGVRIFPNKDFSSKLFEPAFRRLNLPKTASGYQLNALDRTQFQPARTKLIRESLPYYEYFYGSDLDYTEIKLCWASLQSWGLDTDCYETSETTSSQPRSLKTISQYLYLSNFWENPTKDITISKVSSRITLEHLYSLLLASKMVHHRLGNSNVVPDENLVFIMSRRLKHSGFFDKGMELMSTLKPSWKQFYYLAKLIACKEDTHILVVEYLGEALSVCPPESTLKVFIHPVASNILDFQNSRKVYAPI